MDEPRFIGIDSAATSGWAFQVDFGDNSIPRRKWECGIVRADSPQKSDVLSFAKEHSITHAVIEKPMPFLARGGKGKTTMATYGSMCINYGRWVEACECVGLTVVPCLVNQWQPAILVRNGQRIKQDEKKAGSLFIAKMLGAFCRNGDEADAVCLATYGMQALARMVNDADEKAEKKRASAKAARERKKATA